MVCPYKSHESIKVVCVSHPATCPVYIELMSTFNHTPLTAYKNHESITRYFSIMISGAKIHNTRTINGPIVSYIIILDENNFNKIFFNQNRFEQLTNYEKLIILT